MVDGSKVGVARLLLPVAGRTAVVTQTETAIIAGQLRHPVEVGRSLASLAPICLTAASYIHVHGGQCG